MRFLKIFGVCLVIAFGLFGVLGGMIVMLGYVLAALGATAWWVQLSAVLTFAAFVAASVVWFMERNA
jgi:hypothetical protein